MSRPATAPGVPRPHVLREYSFLADGCRGAVIGPRGDVVWMCAPLWHDDAVFSALIGGRGHYTIAPADDWFVWGGHYEDHSLVFRDRWVTSSGVLQCREALAAPGDPHRAVFVRRVTAPEAPTRFRVELNPRANFGRAGLRDVSCEDGVWTARTGRLRIRWQGAPEARPDPEVGLVLDLDLRRGASHDFVLEVSDRALPTELPDAGICFAETENHWEILAHACTDSAAPRDAELALAILTGLTSPGGGMVAAATMSLPERAEAGRNYDYRYAWVRDQCYAGLAAASLGSHPLVADAVSFVASLLIEHGPQLAPAYTVTGEAVPDESHLRGPVGYPGGSNKVGNWVNGQFQLDAVGESLQLFAAAARTGQITTEARQAVAVAVEVIGQRWREPDAGIWELEPRLWTHSRLACVAGLRAVATPGLLLDGGAAARCESLADLLLAEAGKVSTHASGRWQRAPDDERVDAALLLPTVRGALSPNDPRAVATRRAVMEELSRDGYTYRFRQDDRPLHEAEGAFLLCGFIEALASLSVGDLAAAARAFERNRAACGSPGLLAEEYDVQQRQLRGNIPQAFVHALLFETSMALGRAAGERDFTPSEQ